MRTLLIFVGEDVMISPVSLYDVMYLCVMAGLITNRAITYSWVYESTSKMNVVNMRV